MARLSLLLAAALATSGCSIMHAQSRVDPRTVAIYSSSALKSQKNGGCFSAQPFDDANPGTVNLDCATFPDVPEQDGVSRARAYELAVWGSDAAGQLAIGRAATIPAQHYRNRLAAMLMKHSDDVCIATLGRAANNEAVSNVLLNILTTTLAATSTIVTGDLAKSILSGGATITSGSRDHINADVFRNKITSAVTQAIGNERRKLSDTIDGNLRLSPDDYTTDMMIRDVNRYHQECSYIRGLELVVKSVDRQSVSKADRVAALDETIGRLSSDIDKVKHNLPPDDLEKLKTQLGRTIELRGLVAALPEPASAPTTPQVKPDDQ
ncbi:MAG: hypothetical protein ACREB5_03830 [Sphingomonadaceae bacterium]